jgi:Asp-tRNA(Asn)/Glu-tRNA(Gln) amidotransferase C subunit
MPVKFKLYDQEVTFSDEQSLYNSIRLRYEEFSKEAAEEFKEYYKKVGNLDNFIEKGMEIGSKIINLYVGKLLDELVKLNIYDWTLNSIESKYGKIYLKDWVMAFVDVENQYMEIVLHGEQLDAYRIARRENRGRWQGGGFGLEGAVKGAAMAGAMNLVSGAVYGTANLIGKGITMAGDSIKKRGIYTNQDTIASLTNGIMLSVFRLHFVLCDILKIPTMPINAEKSQALLENLSRIQDVQKQQELIVQGLFYNPYNSKLYKFAVENMKDKKGELQKFADFFGYKETVLGYKIDIIESKFKNRVYTTLEQAEQGIQEIKLEKNTLSIPDSRSFPEEKRVLESREKIEIDMRTIDNVLFDTIEDADSARQKKCILQQKLSQTAEMSYEDALDIKQTMLSKFSEKEKNVCQKETELLDNLIKNLDFARRTYKDVLYDSVEERQQAVLDDEKLQVQFEGIWDSVDKLNEALENIKEMNIPSKLRDKYRDDIGQQLFTFIHNEIVDKANYSIDALVKIWDKIHLMDIPSQFLEKLEKEIKDDLVSIKIGTKCEEFLSKYSSKYNYKALRSQGIYLFHDASILQNKTTGFFIGETKIVCMKIAYALYIETTFEELASTQTIYWKDRQHLYADNSLIAYQRGASETLSQDLLQLFQDIHDISQKIYLQNVCALEDEFSADRNSNSVNESIILTETESKPSIVSSTSASEVLKSDISTIIKELCDDLIQKHQEKYYSSITNKLRQGLEINANEEVYLSHDDTIFKSGKNGFAVTENGIYCRGFMEKTIYTSYLNFGATSKIYYKDKLKSELYADNNIVAYQSGMLRSEPDDLLAFFEKLRLITVQYADTLAVVSVNEGTELVKSDNNTKSLSGPSGLPCPKCKMWLSGKINVCPRCGTAITKNSD